MASNKKKKKKLNSCFGKTTKFKTKDIWKLSAIWKKQITVAYVFPSQTTPRMIELTMIFAAQ